MVQRADLQLQRDRRAVFCVEHDLMSARRRYRVSTFCTPVSSNLRSSVFKHHWHLSKEDPLHACEVTLNLVVHFNLSFRCQSLSAN